MQQIQREIKTGKKQISPLAIGLTGALIGAASVAAVALSDEETRKKATKKAKQMRDDLQTWSTKTIQDVKQQGQTLRTSTRNKIEGQKEDASREIKERLDEQDL